MVAKEGKRLSFESAPRQRIYINKVTKMKMTGEQKTRMKKLNLGISNIEKGQRYINIINPACHCHYVLTRIITNMK